MAKIKFVGIEEYIEKLDFLRDQDKTLGPAIYEGGKVMADAMKQAINAIPVDTRTAKSGEMLTGITPSQKRGLQESFGIAGIENDNGYLNVKLGFDGYNSTVTKTYPKGQANAMIANSVNAGTSFRQRIPFVDDTVRLYKARTERAIEKKLDEILKDLMR